MLPRPRSTIIFLSVLSTIHHRSHPLSASHALFSSLLKNQNTLLSFYSFLLFFTLFTLSQTSWDPPAEWVKADRKAHPEKYAAKLPAATGKGQNASLDSLGLHAGGNPGGLGGLGLGGEYKSNSAASGLQGLMNKGKSGNGTGGGMGGGMGGLGGGGMGLGATDESASVYAIKNEENGENGDESEALIGGGVGQDKNEGGVRRYANTRQGRADEILDKIVDKCVEKCPKRCCGTMRWAWKYEGQPLKL